MCECTYVQSPLFLIHHCEQWWLLYKSGFVSHGIEYRLLIGKQVLGRVEFRHDALVQHQNSVRIHHSVDSVRNGQNRTVGKLASDGALDNSIRLNINSSRGFIEDQNGRLAKKSTGKADKLSRKLPMVTKRRKSYLFFLCFTWRWPTEKFSPPSRTTAFSLPSMLETWSLRCASSKASQISASVDFPKGSYRICLFSALPCSLLWIYIKIHTKFSRTLPAKRTGSCGIMVRRDLIGLVVSTLGQNCTANRINILPKIK